MTAAQAANEDPVHAAKHCLDSIPYRMVVFSKLSPHQKPLYLVAGSIAPPAGAEKALREAHRVHGGDCFYCQNPVKQGELSIDHAEPEKLGGRDDIQNLLVSCKPCNSLKNHRPIEAFDPKAGREWLNALLIQVQDRLDRMTQA